MFKNNLQKNKKQDKKFKEKGFTLLFAVLVSTLVLAIGASIISIALKQVILSGSARDSQFAFYAANTGVECALYWDYNGLTSANDGGPIFIIDDMTQSGPNGSENIQCAKHNIISDSEGSGGFDNNCISNIDTDTGFCYEKNTNLGSPDNYRTKFRIEFDNVEYCADVIVDKYVSDGSDGKTSGQTVTTIESRGYNTCDETNPRRIERTLNIEA
jgi:hypothetical protein